MLAILYACVLPGVNVAMKNAINVATVIINENINNAIVIDCVLTCMFFRSLIFCSIYQVCEDMFEIMMISVHYN